MKEFNHGAMADYFGWENHLFTDTRQLTSPFMGDRDKRIMQQAPALLGYGKSFAIWRVGLLSQLPVRNP